MGFNTFAILALFIAFAGLRTARDIIRDRRAIFDNNFTDYDRHMVLMTAFYFLVPLSVILHECGHAIMVKVFGAQIVDYGFYFFAGFVSYQGFLTPTQAIIIAVAGPTVNVILAAIALGLMTLKRPPFRAAVNELLLQFIILSVANTLIFYPLLDLGLNMGGDFHQIYFGGVHWLAYLIGAIHVGILLGGYLAFKNERISAYFARLTGLPPGVHRGFMGGLRLSGQAASVRAGLPSPAQRLLEAAAQRVASGWDVHVASGLDRRPNAITLVMQWQRHGDERVVFVSAATNGPVAMIGLTDARGPAAKRIELARWPALPAEDQLVLALRLGMETVDSAASDAGPALAPA